MTDTLTRAQCNDLRTIAGLMIPASEEYKVPGADDAAVQADILKTLGRDTKPMAAALDHLARLAGKPLAELDAARRGAVVQEVTYADLLSRAATIAAQINTKLARFLGALLLLFHRDVEPDLVDGEPTLASDIRSEVRRKAVGVVKFENRRAIDFLAFEMMDRFFEQRHPIRQGLGEALFFLFQNPLNMRTTARELRISSAHLTLEHRNELVEESVLDP